jgi:hemerythrin-like domain-containing protein
MAEHIRKEDHLLYPMAEQVLPATALESLSDEFDEIESSVMDEGASERLHELADRLITRFPPGTNALNTPMRSPSLGG